MGSPIPPSAVAIVGSRTFADRTLVERTIDRLATIHSDLRIVSGGAHGADSLAEGIARSRGIPTIIHPADWATFGRSAGYRRNQDIVADAEMVIAFFAPGPRSRGTQHTVDIALAAGCPVHVYHDGAWTDR